MQQFATFRGMFFTNYFWYHLQINFYGIWSCKGPINPPVIPTSRPGYALCSFVVRFRAPREYVRKAFTAHYHQQCCQKMPVSMLSSFYQCQLGCCFKVFACFSLQYMQSTVLLSGGRFLLLLLLLSLLFLIQ